MEERYIYAEKTEQIKKTNRFLTIGVRIYYVWILIISWVATVRGIRTFGFSGLLTAVIVLFTVLESIDYKKDNSSTKARYIAAVGLFFVSAIMVGGFNNYYVRFVAVIPFIGSVIFYDKKFAKITGIAFGILNIISNIIKIGILHKFQGEMVIEQICATIAICIMFMIIYIAADIGGRFNYDTRHSLIDEQKKQKQMLDGVLKVAGEVRTGTQNAMELVNELHSSTNVVNEAMKDISDSTQNTAENIQIQTAMTQNIQSSIGKTMEHSDNMVKTAKKSEELNGQSLEIMNHLKRQSEVIADTNSEVAAAMKKLQDRMGAVKNIADTIFSISSQTNLLALNASIESARAGEAGKGFAVVADEIRQLAEKTRQETENIAVILNELSDNAQNAANAVEKSVNAALQQDTMIDEASVSFESMNTNVNSLTDEVGQINKMLFGLSEANNKIVENIMQLSAATQEVTASAQQAEGLSTGNLNNAENTKSLLNSVLDVSHELDLYIK